MIEKIVTTKACSKIPVKVYKDLGIKKDDEICFIKENGVWYVSDLNSLHQK